MDVVKIAASDRFVNHDRGCMQVFFWTLEAVVTLLGVGVIGFWLVGRRVVPHDALKALLPLALDVALPCTIFFNVTRSFVPDATPGWWRLPLVWVLFTAVAFAITMLIRLLLRPPHAAEFSAALFYQNALFFPMVILPRLCGAESNCLVHLLLFTLPFSAFFFRTAPLFFGKARNRIRWWAGLIPVPAATLLAIVLRLTNTQEYVPQAVFGITELLGGMAIPLLMVVIGGNLYLDFNRRTAIPLGEVLWFVAAKNVLFPLLAFAVLALLRPAYPLALIIMLQSAVPPITAIPLIAERNGGNKSVVGRYLVASFAASVLTIPAAVSLLNMLYSP